MSKARENTIKKPVLTPFIAPGSTTAVTNKELEKRRRKIQRAEALGISLTKVHNNENEYENPYKVEALMYILNDKDVPKDLQRKIELFDEQHKTKINNVKQTKVTK